VLNGYIPSDFFEIYNQSITINVLNPDRTILAEKLIDRDTINNGGFTINFSVTPTRFASIIIQSNKSVTPKTYGISEDERELSFLLLSLNVFENDDAGTESAIREGIELAEQFINADNLVDASKLLNKILEYDPHNIEALNDIVVVKILQKKNDEAKDLLSRVLSLDPENEIAIENFKYLEQNYPTTT